MKLNSSIAFLSLFTVSCLFPSQEEPFSRSEASPVRVVATVSHDGDTQIIPVESDTISPADSIILQGNFSPNRYIKTNAHWWTIDKAYITDDYYLKWGFQESGKHEAVFWVKDQFGDLMSDTVFIWVNQAPILDSTVSPANMSWNIPAEKSGLRFSWHVDDPDPDALLSHRFRLWRKSCASKIADTLVVDTILHRADYTHWKPLSPLCRYSWQVLVEDDFQEVSPSQFTWFFYTSGTDQLGAISLTPGNANILITLSRLGDSLRTLSGPSGSSLIFSDLPAGEYRMFVSDTLHSGYSSQTYAITLNAGQYLDWGTVSLLDKVAPIVTCVDCDADTTERNGWLEFMVTDLGCGLDSLKTEAYLDGLPLQWKYELDTLLILAPSYRLVARKHPLEIRAMDRCGNLSVSTFYMRGDP